MTYPALLPQHPYPGATEDLPPGPPVAFMQAHPDLYCATATKPHPYEAQIDQRLGVKTGPDGRKVQNL